MGMRESHLFFLLINFVLLVAPCYAPSMSKRHGKGSSGNGPVAQWIEHQPSKLVVIGSNPIGIT